MTFVASVPAAAALAFSEIYSCGMWYKITGVSIKQNLVTVTAMITGDHIAESFGFNELIEVRASEPIDDVINHLQRSNDECEFSIRTLQLQTKANIETIRILQESYKLAGLQERIPEGTVRTINIKAEGIGEVEMRLREYVQIEDRPVTLTWELCSAPSITYTMPLDEATKLEA